LEQFKVIAHEINVTVIEAKRTMIESEDKVNQLDSHLRMHEEKTKKLISVVTDCSKRVIDIE